MAQTASADYRPAGVGQMRLRWPIPLWQRVIVVTSWQRHGLRRAEVEEEAMTIAR